MRKLVYKVSGQLFFLPLIFFDRRINGTLPSCPSAGKFGAADYADACSLAGRAALFPAVSEHWVPRLPGSLFEATPSSEKPLLSPERKPSVQRVSGTSSHVL